MHQILSPASRRSIFPRSARGRSPGDEAPPAKLPDVAGGRKCVEATEPFECQSKLWDNAVLAASAAIDTRMLLQTNSYVVPKDRRAEHARLLRRFRQTLMRLGCEHFEVYEQVGSNWSSAEPTGRYVQIMRFRDRPHQLAVQAAERNDPTAQALIAEFCELINFPYQQQQGLFAVGFYS